MTDTIKESWTTFATGTSALIKQSSIIIIITCKTNIFTDALRDAQPTASKHWKQRCLLALFEVSKVPTHTMRLSELSQQQFWPDTLKFATYDPSWWQPSNANFLAITTAHVSRQPSWQPIETVFSQSFLIYILITLLFMTSWIYALNCSCLQFIVAEIVSFLDRVVDCHLNVPVPPTRFFQPIMQEVKRCLCCMNTISVTSIGVGHLDGCQTGKDFGTSHDKPSW